MANNRLFLVDMTTGDKLCLAKGGSLGEWILHPDIGTLAAFLRVHDLGGAQGSRTQLHLLDEHDVDPSLVREWTP